MGCLPVKYIYIDIIWLDNLIMNFIILWASSKLSKYNTPLYRLLVSSLLGATYAVTLVVFKIHLLNSWSIKIILSLIMLLIGFKFTTMGRLFRLMGVFYGVTFAFGGIAFALYFFTEDILSIEEGVFYIKNFPVKILILSSLLFIIFVSTIWPRIRSKLISYNLTYNINIKYKGMDFILNALLDTGNSLYDPITKSPVIIVEYTKIQHVLPIEIRELFQNNGEMDMDIITEALKDSDFIERIRLIPYYAVGKSGGLLLGFKPDKVLISLEGNWREYQDVVVAIYNDKLSRDEYYHALIHPEILSA